MLVTKLLRLVEKWNGQLIRYDYNTLKTTDFGTCTFI